MEDVEDSFDDLLAEFEMPESRPAPSSSAQPSTSKAAIPTETPAAGKSTVPEIIEKPKISHSIRVHPRQRGNPILKSITTIPWEFDSEIVPDYMVGKTACILFLSIRYHNLKPDYINERIKELGKNYELRVLLVHVDIKESQNALKVKNSTNLTFFITYFNKIQIAASNQAVSAHRSHTDDCLDT